MLNRLPENSSSEKQHSSFQVSGSCREWEEEENQLAQTEAFYCCKGTCFHLSPAQDLWRCTLFLPSAFIQHILLGCLDTVLIF